MVKSQLEAGWLGSGDMINIPVKVNGGEELRTFSVVYTETVTVWRTDERFVLIHLDNGLSYMVTHDTLIDVI